MQRLYQSQPIALSKITFVRFMTLLFIKPRNWVILYLGVISIFCIQLTTNVNLHKILPNRIEKIITISILGCKIGNMSIQIDLDTII